MAEIIAVWKPQLKWPSKLSTNLAKLLFNIKLINLTSWGERESALNNFIDSCIYDYINPHNCTMHLSRNHTNVPSPLSVCRSCAAILSSCLHINFYIQISARRYLPRGEVGR